MKKYKINAKNNFSKNIEYFNEMKKQIENGIPLEKNSARIALFSENEKLVNTIINKYFPEHSDDEDLIMLGKITLIKAIDTFDVDKNNQFSTYACKLILNSLAREFQIQNYSKRKISQYTISLETPLFISDSGDEITIEGSLADDDTPIDEKLIEKEQSQLIKKALCHLTPKEQFIIICFVGLYNIPPASFKYGTEILNISRQRFYNLKDIAINKLKLLLKDPKTLTYEEKVTVSQLKNNTYPLVKNANDYLTYNSDVSIIKKQNKVNIGPILLNLKNFEKRLTLINTTSKLKYLNNVTYELFLFINKNCNKHNFSIKEKDDILTICKYAVLNCVNSYATQINETNLASYITNSLYDVFENINDKNYISRKLVHANKIKIVEEQPNNLLVYFKYFNEKLYNLKNNGNKNKIIECLKMLSISEQELLIETYNLKSTTFKGINNITSKQKLFLASQKLNLLLKDDIYCSFIELSKKYKLMKKPLNKEAKNN